MRDPKKLEIISVAEDFAVAVYRATSRVPSSERFGLTSQLRRAAVSIGSNIVEGCHRQNNRAFLAFLHHALGSAAEVGYQLRIAGRLGFGDHDEGIALYDQAEHLKAMLIRLIGALKRSGA